MISAKDAARVSQHNDPIVRESRKILELLEGVIRQAAVGGKKMIDFAFDKATPKEVQNEVNKELDSLGYKLTNKKNKIEINW